jgi:hypothetical protein
MPWSAPSSGAQSGRLWGCWRAYLFGSSGTTLSDQSAGQTYGACRWHAPVAGGTQPRRGRGEYETAWFDRSCAQCVASCCNSTLPHSRNAASSAAGCFVSRKAVGKHCGEGTPARIAVVNTTCGAAESTHHDPSLLQVGPSVPAQLRTVRSVELLEQIGNSEARCILETVAKEVLFYIPKCWPLERLKRVERIPSASLVTKAWAVYICHSWPVNVYRRIAHPTMQNLQGAPGFTLGGDAE